MYDDQVQFFADDGILLLFCTHFSPILTADRTISAHTKANKRQQSQLILGWLRRNRKDEEGKRILD